MTNTAIVFPGQGSQSVGMLSDIAPEYSVVKETFDEASAALGYDLWKLVQDGPAESLDKTEHTQPALLTASYAVWKILNISKIPPAKIPPSPPLKRGELNSSLRNSPLFKGGLGGILAEGILLAGHSLGEYTALVCANAINFTDAVKLVAARGRYMQAAVPTGVGAMAAIIGLDETAVEKLCNESVLPNEILSPANFNSVGQIVIAGHKASIENAIAKAKESGAKMAIPIPVSVPSHCQLMMPAAEKLKETLATIEIRKPTLPVINNVDVKVYDSAEAIRDGLTRQLYNPVRWVETIQAFTRDGVNTVIECGPGKVLTGLNKRIDKQLQLMATADLVSLRSAI